MSFNLAYLFPFTFASRTHCPLFLLLVHLLPLFVSLRFYLRLSFPHLSVLFLLLRRINYITTFFGVLVFISILYSPSCFWTKPTLFLWHPYSSLLCFPFLRYELFSSVIRSLWCMSVPSVLRYSYKCLPPPFPIAPMTAVLSPQLHDTLPETNERSHQFRQCQSTCHQYTLFPEHVTDS